MTSMRFVQASLLTLAIGAAPVLSQSIVYPSQGQSPEQQAKDQSECNAWAQQSTGIDPLVIAQQSASQPVPSGNQHSRAKGALGGAAAGAAIGAIAGDTGEGAAIGAVVGTLGGGMRERRRQKEEQATAQSYQQQTQQALDTYTRAVSACMQGRHYVVN